MNKLYVAALYLIALVEFVTANYEEDYEYGYMMGYKMPDCCVGKEYCFSNENYPIGKVKELLTGDLLRNLILDIDDGNSSDVYSNRQGDSLNCGMIKNDLIYYIVDDDENVRVVLQLKGILQQKFTVRTCKTPNERELESKLNIKSQHTVHCNERLREYDFLVLSAAADADGKYKIEIVTKSLPVCCACTYDKD